MSSGICEKINFRKDRYDWVKPDANRMSVYFENAALKQKNERKKKDIIIKSQSDIFVIVYSLQRAILSFNYEIALSV